MGKAIVIGISIFVIILAILAGLLYYSYTQIDVTLTDVNYISIEWAEFSWEVLINLGLNILAGNWLDAAFDLVEAINLDLEFTLYNGGLLPVYIPELTYDLFVNDVNVGKGFSPVNLTINPGQTREISVMQNFQKNSLAPTVKKIVASDGVMILKVSGTAHFKMWFLDIPIPFESTKSISIKDEIRKKLDSEIQRLQPETAETAESIVQSFVEGLDGNVQDLELRLSGDYLVDKTYRVGPGSYTFVGFEKDCSFNLQGGFIANAILGDDIYVYVVDEDNFQNYDDGQKFSSSYDSGKVEYDIFDLNLAPGKYYIIISNQYSLFSTKTVQLEAATSCR